MIVVVSGGVIQSINAIQSMETVETASGYFGIALCIPQTRRGGAVGDLVITFALGAFFRSGVRRRISAADARILIADGRRVWAANLMQVGMNVRGNMKMIERLVHVRWRAQMVVEQMMRVVRPW